MAGGLNLKFKIIRINYDPDDVVGGAVTTGTTVYENVFGRLEATPPEQILMQQGLETDRSFTIFIKPGNLDIRERDYAVVTYPLNHPYYDKDLRIVGVIYSSHTPDDPRNYMLLYATHSVRAHTIQ